MSVNQNQKQRYSSKHITTSNFLSHCVVGLEAGPTRHENIRCHSGMRLGPKFIPSRIACHLMFWNWSDFFSLSTFDETIYNGELANETKNIEVIIPTDITNGNSYTCNTPRDSLFFTSLLEFLNEIEIKHK